MAKARTNETSDVRDNILAVGQRIMAGKGFSAVGLNEILTEAKVPKGSFYHYFASKDAFGEALLAHYFDDYLADVDAILDRPGRPMAQRLLEYFDMWRANQSFLDCQGKCLAVKLAAEVADLSEAMRAVLNEGTSAIVDRLTAAIEGGVDDGSLAVDDAPRQVAQSLYQLWLGASVMVKIARGPAPFESALAVTRHMLHLRG
ncbi:TetR family transcriptional regulator [Pseudoduganella flava]|uniref:TetR family transcriptional regulator n=1 Tax=Pseudoduganella flava TaxID=871742 RepID=A0A562PZU2_9BURK|nr:TetR/AcrR family transcriptional regulator [Pseudoduganella flava]QGZ38538.1 TetR family transcriptional regulator [Pseudoduganella flava]TWI49903.1 TetR family transcriptional regulator [Pseudoduganella flava]